MMGAVAIILLAIAFAAAVAATMIAALIGFFLIAGVITACLAAIILWRIAIRTTDGSHP